MLVEAVRDIYEEVFIQFNSQVKLFNLSCLKAKGKVSNGLVKEFPFVDDSVFIVHSDFGIKHL